MKKALIALAVLAITFLAGYVPMYLNNRSLEQSSQEAMAASETRVKSLTDQLTIANLTGDMGMVLIETQQKNFGRAKDLASAFFDNLRQAAGGVEDAAIRDQLSRILSRRDEIISDLTSLDPAIDAKLRGIYVELHGIVSALRAPK